MGFFKDKTFFKIILVLAVPIILQEMLNASVNMMDTFMIGRLGEAEVAAVGLANQIFFLFSLILFGISSGAVIFMGQYWGKQDIKSIHKVMGIAFSLGLAFALVFFIGGTFFPKTVMNIYSQDEKVIGLGIEYLEIIVFSYFFSAIIVSINAALRATGYTKYPMITTFISLICNVTFNYIFIFVMGLGVKGAAIGTLCARCVEISAQVFLLYHKKLSVAAKIKNYFTIDKKFVKDFFVISLPVIANEFMWALGTSVYNIAYKYSGTDAQAAVQISSTVQNLFIVVGMGVGFGSSIMLSNSLGAGDIKKAISYSRKCLVLAVILSVFMGVGLIFMTPTIISFFDVSTTVKDYASSLLFVTAVGLAFKTFNYTSIVGILRSGGDTKFCFVVDTASVWLIGVPFAFLGSYFLGLPIYATVALVYTEEIFKIFLSSRRVFKNKWAKNIID